MSIDRTLRIKSSLQRHRNVLTRDERVAKLKAEERWSDDMNVIGMRKVGNRKVKAGKKAQKSESSGE